MARVRLGWFLFAIVALGLAGCGRAPLPADPALWQVEGPQGQRAWLLGTIHAAPRPLDWRSEAVERAMGEADEVFVEVATLADEKASARIFAHLAATEGMPSLADRLPPGDRLALHAALEQTGNASTDFSRIETWAAALMLARAGAVGGEARHGVDRAVIAAAGDRPVRELEGTAGQLSLFDRLPEAEQRDMLAAVVREAADPPVDILEAWRTGDMAAIERTTRTGLLADPQLREALFTSRNRAWMQRIVLAMAAGRKPFVAVGAAHMAGPDGLVAMLKAAGCRVTRLR
jgi:uncharacterized protein